MLKTYTTPEMLVHGTIEQLTQVAGRDDIADVLIFNGDLSNPAAESDDSISLDCKAVNDCDPFKLQ
ncbi:lasso peptide [Moorena sp. SIO3H5]|uniref:lasso peptide n=1 Tax=Moorena sp. SIO3H5 TaxID=2607834 RepID=UPI0013BCF5E9|nr:lasso peptide [Moorena sp. SIO3H5]NEO74039.1 lasso peptide [Moorena sp. SIO3H5]